MIILTSFAADVMDRLIPYFPKAPKEMSVLFIPTGADPYKNKDWMYVDRNKLIQLGFKVSDFDLVNKKESEVREALSKTDIVFVGGGNAYYLLENVRKSSFDKVVKELLAKDLIYIGSSAGSVILGPNIEPMKYLDDPSKAPNLSDYKGLNLINFIILPHYNQKKYDKAYNKLNEKYKDLYKLKPLNDNQAIIITSGKNQKVITNVN